MESECDVQKLAQRLFRAKRERRRELAALPFEEKLRIVSEMQKLAKEIASVRGKMKRRSKPERRRTKRKGASL